MDLGSIFFGLALVVLTGAFIARPFFEGRATAFSKSERHLSELQAERDRILATISELDMDHTMGKIIPEDYRPQREALVSRGAEVLRMIDALQGIAVEPILDSDRDVELDAELESAVAQLRTEHEQADGGFCGSCGEKVVAEDQFCSRCGARLLTEEV